MKTDTLSEHSITIKPAVLSSVFMAVGGMADALLYVHLPVNGNEIGISFIYIGILLSVNKFVRFFANSWIARLAEIKGIKFVQLSGIVLSALTTVVYACNPHIAIWITARLLWGVAYSAFRYTTFHYTLLLNKQGFVLGLGRSIQEFGPLMAYWIGPILIINTGASVTFLLFALLTFFTIPFAIRLPDSFPVRQNTQTPYFDKPTWFDWWIFGSAFAVEGILITGISKILTFDGTASAELLLWTAGFISLRRLSVILISPVSGILSDKLGYKNVFIWSGLLTFSGLFLISLDYPRTGIIAAFTASTVVFTISPIIAVQNRGIEKINYALTALSTSRDMGSAFGSLFGLAILNALSPQSVFLTVSVLLLLIGLKLKKSGI